MNTITYGITCERSPIRTLALEAVRSAARPYALARGVRAREECSDDGVVIVAMRDALEHAEGTAARLLPQGEVGGVLIEEARTAGFEDASAFVATV